MKITYSSFHPFIRKVGIGVNISQRAVRIAYDHRMICVLDGNGSIEYNGKDSLIGPYDLLLIRPGIPYRVNAKGKQTLAVVNFDCTYAHVEISQPVPSVCVGRFQTDRMIDHSDLSQMFEVDADELIRFEGNEEINQLFCRMYQLYMTGQISAKSKYLMLSALLEQVVAMMLEHSPNEVGKTDTMAEKIYLYIHRHYAEPITLKELSEEFHFHENYINRLLRRNYNVSFHKLLVSIRLEQVVLLLENTDSLLSEVAEQTGFGSLRQMTDCFKKNYGMTPSDYRKKKDVSFSLI